LNVAAWQLADATFAPKRWQVLNAWLQKTVAIVALEIRSLEQMAAADSKRIVLFDVDGTLTAARKVRSQDGAHRLPDT